MDVAARKRPRATLRMTLNAVRKLSPSVPDRTIGMIELVVYSRKFYDLLPTYSVLSGYFPALLQIELSLNRFGLL